MIERTDIVELISKIPLFADLNQEELEVLAEAFRIELYPPNTVVYRQGEAGDTMYVMADGRGLLLKAETNSQEKKVGTVKRGVVVGTSSIFAEDERDVTFVIVRHSTLYALTRSGFQNACTLRRSIEEKLNFEGREDLRELLEARRLSFDWLHTDMGETILLCSRRHKWSFYRRLIGSFLVFGILGTLIFTLTTALGVWLIGALFALVFATIFGAIAWFFYLDWKNDYFVVTNKRVVHEERILQLLGQQIIRQAPLRNVQNVIVEQEGFIPNAFDFAEVRIETAGPEGTILFDMVSDAEKIRETILRLYRRYETRSAAERRANIRREIERRLGTELQQRGAEEVEEEIIEHRAAASLREKNLEEETEQETQPPPEPKTILGDAWQSFREYVSPRIRVEQGNTVIYRKHWLILFQVLWQPVTVLFLLSLLTITRLTSTWPPVLMPLEQLTSPVGMCAAYWVFLIPNIIWLWWSYEDWRNDLYKITPNAAIDFKDTPLFFGERREIQAPLSQIQAVTSRQLGWVGRIFNLGTVTIQTAGHEGTLDWLYVFNPSEVAAAVNNRLHAAREEEIEEKDIEQADLLAEWLAIYHQTVHPEKSYSGEETELYQVQEAPASEETEEPKKEETPEAPTKRPPPFEKL